MTKALTVLILPYMDIQKINNSIEKRDNLIKKFAGKSYEVDARRFILWLDGNNKPLNGASFIEFYKLAEANAKISVGMKQIYALRRIAKAFLRTPLSTEQRLDFELAIMEMKPLVETNEKVADIIKDKVLSPEDIQTLIQKCDPKMSLLFEFMASTGLRISEVLSVCTDEFDIQPDWVWMTGRGKGHKVLHTKITRELYERILIGYGRSSLLFHGRLDEDLESDGQPLVYKTVGRHIRNECWNILGRDNVTPHVLRHTFGTNLIKQGVPLNEVSRLMNHSRVDITAKFYDHTEINYERVTSWWENPIEKV